MDKKSNNKKKADPQKKLLITAIKKTISHNSVLHIMEYVYLNGTHAEMTDLENTIIFPFKSEGVNVCFPADRFIDVLEIMESPTFTQTKDFCVTVTQDKRKIKVLGDNPDNFPLNALTMKSAPDYTQIATWGEKELGYLRSALPLVSKDDLRPAMTGIYCADEIAATDAHRLYSRKIDRLPCNFIIPSKGVKLLLMLGGSEWMVFVDMDSDKSVTHIIFINPEGVILITRAIDARFPDFKVVIPKGDPVYKLIWHTDLMLNELKIAKKFCNRSTNQVAFFLNKKAPTINAQEVDFSFEYQNELKGAEVHKDTPTSEDLSIAFNANLMIDILTLLPKDEPLTINMWASTKAAIINDHYLLMPLMLNQ